MEKQYLIKKEKGGVSVKKFSINDHINLPEIINSLKEAAINCFLQSEVQKELSSKEFFRGQAVGIISAANMIIERLEPNSENLLLSVYQLEKEAKKKL